MENRLLETYKRRLALSEQVHKEAHGVSMTIAQKNTVARVLANTSAYLNEAFSNSVGTQRSDMAEFKKFALDLTTVALPNLIANDLVIVKPMSSMTGYIQYLRFTAGSNKGGVEQGKTVFNDPFALYPMTDARIDYTSRFVSDLVQLENGEGFLAWTPIAKDENGKFIASLVGAESGAEIEVLDGETGKIRVSGTSAEVVKVKYVYDNVRIPQNDLPIYNAHMEGIGLEAHARRIAIYYSQMAAFQAKQEMGLDLGAVLATQACAELSYEIDTEIVKLLVESAPVDVTLKFKRVPVGIAKAEHYEGFAEVIEQASQVIYDRTQKHAANYMICASNVKPVLALMKGWKAASTTKINGPYLAGTINGIKVFVSPAIKPGKFVMGFNGDDLITSAAVYAPYMAIVPTALLQFADGGNSQGFSTLYDLKLLNTALLVAGEIVDVADAEANQTVSVSTGA